MKNIKPLSKKTKRVIGLLVLSTVVILLSVLAFPPIDGTWRLHFTDRIGQQNEVIFKNGTATYFDTNGKKQIFGEYKRIAFNKFGWYYEGGRIGTLVLYTPFIMKIRCEGYDVSGQYYYDDGGGSYGGRRFSFTYNSIDSQTRMKNKQKSTPDG